MPRTNYDDIAHLYDEPSRDHGVDSNLLAYLSERPAPRDAQPCILDIGCGTGKQLAADHERWPGHRLVGIDRFRAMLQIARRRCPSVAWMQADGVALPLAANTFDYATSQFSYPHIGRTRQFLFEVFRVLRGGGRFVMTNIDPWSMPGWLVYQYFPEAYARDRQDFVTTERLMAFMGEAGFVHLRMFRSDLSRDERLQEFLAYASDRHRASQLLAISDAEYKEGLLRLERAVVGGARTVERSEFVVVTIVGDKPELEEAG